MEIPEVQKYASIKNGLIFCEQYNIIQSGWHIKSNYKIQLESINGKR